MSHRTRVTDVDIVIKPGWSQVPINRIMELRDVVTDGREEYLTRVACEKMATNLKLYRSLNTRPTPTKGLQAQLARCMVAYRRIYKYKINCSTNVIYTNEYIK